MKRIGRRSFLNAAGLSLGLALQGKWSKAFGDDHQSPSRGSAESYGLRPAAGSVQPQVIVRRGYTDCRFGQLHYIRGVPAAGASSKPPLVLIHQNPSSSVEYEPLLNAMATDREVVAFDTPGNGMSDWPPQPLDIAGYAGAFADGIEGLSLANRGPVDVFGYHTGTLLGAELAIAQPDSVGRLVMSGIPFRTPEERQERLEEIEARPRLTEDGEDILGQLRRLWTFVVSKRNPDVPLERAAQIFMEKAKPLDRYWWPYRGVWTYEVKERFPLISQPVMILQPHEALLEYSVQSAQFISDVQIVEVPELDRDVFDVGSAIIARKLRAFLT